MKRRILALCAVMALTFSWMVGTAYAAGSTGGAAVNSRNGVARVLTLYDVDLYDPGTGEYARTLTGYGSGSGFGVGKAGKETDVFVTNRHVVTVNDGPVTFQGNIYYGKYQVSGYYILKDSFAYNSDTFTLDSSRAIPCTVVYIGESDDADVAVLRAAEPVPGRMALPLLDNENGLQVTDAVSSLGYPGSADDATSEGYLLANVSDMVVNSGNVSRFYDSASVTGSSGQLSGHLIQHTATINHGNSGGPLLDKNGAVVGINTYGVGQDVQTGDVNSYYALRIRYAKDALDSLNIQYDVYKAGLSPLVLVIVLAAIAAVIVVVLAVVLGRRKKRDQNQNGQAAPVINPAPAGAELRIQGQSGSFAGRRFSINGQVRIGRDPAANDLVYPASTPGISGRHCVVTLSGGQVMVTDLGSSYGTFLAGGRKLAPNQPTPLRIGDRFYLGSEKESFVITGKGGSLT